MKLPYIKLFCDASATIDMLSDAEAGRLLKALMHYANDITDTLPGQEKLVFSMLKSQIDRDAASYQDFLDKQRENGKKGGRPKKPSLSDESPNNPSLFEKTQKTQEKEKEKEKEKIIKENTPKGVKEKPLTRFTPPTVEEVSVYCRERNNSVNAQRFVDFYTAKGWKVGQNPMKDWKAAVRTWEQRDDSPARPAKVVSAQQYGQRQYVPGELDAVSDDLMAEARKRRDTA